MPARRARTPAGAAPTRRAAAAIPPIARTTRARRRSVLTSGSTGARCRTPSAGACWSRNARAEASAPRRSALGRRDLAGVGARRDRAGAAHVRLRIDGAAGAARRRRLRRRAAVLSRPTSPPRWPRCRAARAGDDAVPPEDAARLPASSCRPLDLVLSATAPLVAAARGARRSSARARRWSRSTAAPRPARSRRAAPPRAPTGAPSTASRLDGDGARARTVQRRPRAAADAARRRARGRSMRERFRLLGRSNDLIHIAGKRSSLGAPELPPQQRSRASSTARSGCPRRCRADVVRLVAFVVAPALDADAILAALRERIDPAFVPRRIVHVDALPREPHRQAAARRASRELAARLAAAAAGDDERRVTPRDASRRRCRRPRTIRPSPATSRGSRCCPASCCWPRCWRRRSANAALAACARRRAALGRVKFLAPVRPGQRRSRSRSEPARRVPSATCARASGSSRAASRRAAVVERRAMSRACRHRAADRPAHSASAATCWRCASCALDRARRAGASARLRAASDHALLPAARGRARRDSARYLARALGRARDAGATATATSTPSPSTVLDRVYLAAGALRPVRRCRPRERRRADRRDARRRRGVFLSARTSAASRRCARSAHERGLRVAMVMYQDNARLINATLAAIAPERAAAHDRARPRRLDARAARWLDDGGLVGLLADRTLPATAARAAPSRCRSSARPARFSDGPFRLAAMLRRRVVFMAGLYLGGNRYELRFDAAGRLQRPHGPDDARRARRSDRAPRCSATSPRSRRCAARRPYNWFNFYDFWADDDAPTVRARSRLSVAACDGARSRCGALGARAAVASGRSRAPALSTSAR